MDENLHNIDDIFKSGLDSHEEIPSSHVWENLEASLDKKDVVAYKKKFIVVRRIAAVLVLLLLSFLAYELTTRNQVPPEEVEQNKSTEQGTIPLKKEKSKIKSSTRSPFQSGSSKEKSLPPQPGKRNADSLFIQLSNQTGHRHNQQSAPEKNRHFHGSIDMATTLKKRPVVHGVPGINSLPVTASHSYQQVTGLARENKWQQVQHLIKNDSNSQSEPGLLPDKKPVPVSEATMVFNAPKKIVIHHIVPQLTIPVVSGGKLFKPSWSVTGIVAHDWYRNKLKDDETDYTGGLPNHNEREEIEQHERLQPTVGFAILGNYRFRKNMMIQAGMLYSKSVMNAGPRHIYAQKTTSGDVAYKLNLSSGFTYINTGPGSHPNVGDSLETTYTHNNIQYFSIPVIFHYLKSIGRITFSPGIGIAASFVTGTRVHTEIVDGSRREEEEERSIEGLKPANLRLVLTGDLTYSINRRWSLCIVPAYRYSLTSITKNSIVKSFPNNFSAGAGFMYNF
jgi:hypothetical protein